MLDMLSTFIAAGILNIRFAVHMSSIFWHIFDYFVLVIISHYEEPEKPKQHNQLSPLQSKMYISK